MYELTLPIPPANNRYYRHARGRTYLSAEGKAYKRAVNLLARPIMLKGSLRIEVEIHSRDNRRRDIDGYPKGLFDALTNAGVWEDDSQVDEMEFVRGENNKINPHLKVKIFKI